MLKPNDYIPEREKDGSPVSGKIDAIIPRVMQEILQSRDEVGEDIQLTDVGLPVVSITGSDRKVEMSAENANDLVVVHCRFTSDAPARMNLSPTTYLWDQILNHRSRLLYAHGMAIDPDEMQIAADEVIRFTLIFAPLPPRCQSFWFWENTYEPFSFHAVEIQRTRNDVYEIELETAPI